MNLEIFNLFFMYHFSQSFVFFLIGVVILVLSVLILIILDILLPRFYAPLNDFIDEASLVLSDPVNVAIGTAVYVGGYVVLLTAVSMCSIIATFTYLGMDLIV